MYQNESERIRALCELLFQATKPIQILSHISWPANIREDFFANNATKIPQISYPPFEPKETLEILEQAKKLIGESGLIEDWFRIKILDIEYSAKMLATCGTPDFYKYSKELFGAPADPHPDETSTSLSLAKQFNSFFKTLSNIDIGEPEPACNLAELVAEKMQKAAHKMFGAEAPEILIVDELSANALAGPKRIKIRRGACFTDKDIYQLIHHEAHIHVATSLNGMAQQDLKILGVSYPSNTRTQEGLAVFAEFITGSMDLDRMQRLSDRVIAIQMSVEGADFMEIYRYFLGRTKSEEQAFENTRRVFRGGVLTGGAPFTKDIVYLDGLLRVHNFLQTIVSTGRTDCLRLLFCGKLDIEDIPVLYEFTKLGLCQPPKYLPPWAEDMRFLLCYLAYSSFLHSSDSNLIQAHYDQMLANIPTFEQMKV